MGYSPGSPGAEKVFDQSLKGLGGQESRGFYEAKRAWCSTDGVGVDASGHGQRGFFAARPFGKRVVDEAGRGG